MKSIQERTEWHDYTTIERCQETGRPVEVYSLDAENIIIWNSMTKTEQQKLLKYDLYCEIGWTGLTQEEQQEFRELSDWCENENIDLSLIPENQKAKRSVV